MALGEAEKALRFSKATFERDEDTFYVTVGRD